MICKTQWLKAQWELKDSTIPMWKHKHHNYSIWSGSYTTPNISHQSSVKPLRNRPGFPDSNWKPNPPISQSEETDIQRHHVTWLKFYNLPARWEKYRRPILSFWVVYFLSHSYRSHISRKSPLLISCCRYPRIGWWPCVRHSYCTDGKDELDMFATFKVSQHYCALLVFSDRMLRAVCTTPAPLTQTKSRPPPKLLVPKFFAFSRWKQRSYDERQIHHGWAMLDNPVTYP